MLSVEAPTDITRVMKETPYNGMNKLIKTHNLNIDVIIYYLTNYCLIYRS